MNKNTKKMVGVFTFTIICLFLIMSCSNSGNETDITTKENDFTPPSGKSTDTKISGYGPWNTRILIATSTDGLTWTRTNTILSDQADVPDAILDSSEKLFVYYITWAKEVRNKIVVAISEDSGKTWSYKKTSVDTQSSWASPVDPDVVLLEDGIIRMYFTSDPNDGSGPRTYSATSSDGVTFTMDSGTRFAKSGSMVLDPTVLKIGETWNYYAGGISQDKNYHATSTDGITFTEQNYISFSDGFKMGNGIKKADGKYWYYGFEGGMPTVSFHPSIKAVESTDGVTWTSIDNSKFSVDTSGGLETDFVKDPAIVQVADGTYLLFYVTEIPK